MKSDCVLDMRLLEEAIRFVEKLDKELNAPFWRGWTPAHAQFIHAEKWLVEAVEALAFNSRYGDGYGT